MAQTKFNKLFLEKLLTYADHAESYCYVKFADNKAFKDWYKNLANPKKSSVDLFKNSDLNIIVKNYSDTFNNYKIAQEVSPGRYQNDIVVPSNVVSTTGFTIQNPPPHPKSWYWTPKGDGTPSEIKFEDKNPVTPNNAKTTKKAKKNKMVVKEGRDYFNENATDMEKEVEEKDSHVRKSGRHLEVYVRMYTGRIDIEATFEANRQTGEIIEGTLDIEKVGMDGVKRAIPVKIEEGDDGYNGIALAVSNWWSEKVNFGDDDILEDAEHSSQDSYEDEFESSTEVGEDISDDIEDTTYKYNAMYDKKHSDDEETSTSKYFR